MHSTHHKQTTKNKDWVILKFGGTSVSTAKNWETVGKIAKERINQGFSPIIVCSALSEISNTLEQLISAATTGEQQPILEKVFTRHKELATELKLSEHDMFFDCFDQLSRLSHGIFLIGESSPSIKARILAQGELLSSKIGAAYLNSIGIKTEWKDARDWLSATEDTLASANRKYLARSCDYGYDKDLNQLLTKKSKESNVSTFITQGFIAKSASGETVLIGRGGSDTSASYLAAKLDAKRLEIWTDVPGIFTANPHQIASARLLKNLDYDEAQELATSGAKVLHPRSIDPVQAANIPINIGWMEHHDHLGTVISNENKSLVPLVKSISVKAGIQIISMDSIKMWQQPGFLADAFNCFKQHDISIDLIATSETNVTVTLNRSANVIDDKTIDNLMKDLEKICSPKTFTSCAAISLVGKNIRTILHKLAPALAAFEDKQIYLVSQASSDLNFTFVIAEEEAEKMLGTLHALFFSDTKDDSTFGKQWNELHVSRNGATEQESETSNPWWVSKQDILLNCAKQETPLYVYDLENIGAQAEKIKKLKTIKRFHYAVKANPHPDILRLFDSKQLHFDCVSTEEIDHLISSIPDIATDKILFTPNFAGIDEYKYALSKNCVVTLDNVHPLEHHPEAFKGAKFLVRVDSGIAKGHHPHVMTSGPKSKFGVSHQELSRITELAKKADAEIIGLHAHVGSGILAAETWAETAGFLAELAQAIPSVKVLDLGGGLGVSEKDGETPLDIYAVEQHLKNFSDQYPQFELWMEPGRYLVAEGGVLLAAVTQLKEKNGKTFVGLNAGMNSLIRPSLYGSWHQITNLSQLDTPATITADVVGPICESGDVIGRGRELPQTSEGDICLIAMTGAYGRVMASSYNLRKPATEIII